MTPEQEQALIEKLTRIGYSTFEVLPGEEEILMLYVRERLICGALYALEMSDEVLKSLIDKTVQMPGD